MEMQSFVCSFSLLLFRPLPDENKEFFLELQKMVEDMAEKTGGPVVIDHRSQHGQHVHPVLPQPPAAGLEGPLHQILHLPGGAVGGRGQDPPRDHLW